MVKTTFPNSQDFSEKFFANALCSNFYLVKIIAFRSNLYAMSFSTARVKHLLNSSTNDMMYSIDSAAPEGLGF